MPFTGRSDSSIHRNIEQQDASHLPEMTEEDSEIPTTIDAALQVVDRLRRDKAKLTKFVKEFQAGEQAANKVLQDEIIELKAMLNRLQPLDNPQAVIESFARQRESLRISKESFKEIQELQLEISQNLVGDKSNEGLSAIRKGLDLIRQEMTDKHLKMVEAGCVLVAKKALTAEEFLDMELFKPFSIIPPTSQP